MNLHKVVRGLITTVNPDITAIGRRYKGSTLGAGRKPVPEYYDDETVTLQLQPLSDGDIKHVDGLNIQGLIKSVHINGSYYSVNREMNKGGDIFIIDGKTWLVVEPMELWPDWSRCLVCLQVDT
ncbi:MAG: hypothetical protein [Caudoviricetes sp.]|nr:MAG: hypothetical protein [Caudoviricetes sp.]